MNNKELLEALKEAHSKVKRTETSEGTEGEVVAPVTAPKESSVKKREIGGSVHGGISEESLEKLKKIGGDEWSPEGILDSLVDELYEVFPAIKIGAEVLCPEMVYRRIDRRELTLRIDSGKRRYRIVSRKRGERYRGWLHYYGQKGVADSALESASMCIYELETYLLDFEDYKRSGWIKVIDPEQYELVT